MLQHPEHVQHLILVGPAGVSSESDGKSEWLTKFRATWKGAVLNHLWESNFTPQKLIRYFSILLIVLTERTSFVKCLCVIYLHSSLIVFCKLSF